jgi:hypothetical protein
VPERRFMLDPNILKRSEERLNAKLMRLRYQVERRKLSREDAKAKGKEALEEAFKVNIDLVNRMARARGLPEAPPEQLDRKILEDAIEKWNSLVDDLP